MSNDYDAASKAIRMAEKIAAKSHGKDKQMVNAVKYKMEILEALQK